MSWQGQPWGVVAWPLASRHGGYRATEVFVSRPSLVSKGSQPGFGVSAA